MPGRLAEHEPRQPKWRIDEARPDEGHFFPSEVAELLAVPELDYRQLRAIHKLVRNQAGAPVEHEVDQRGAGHQKRWRWTRFTFLDVVATREVIRLCLNDEGELPLRLRLSRIEKVCNKLHDLGFENPLVEVDIMRSGRGFVVKMEGDVFEPETGQQRFKETELGLKTHNLLIDPDLLKHINGVRAEFRATNPKRLFEIPIQD
jgi:hypothetical protein